jgi:4-hydroxy-tetrahydrodipicolinate synthase
MAIRKEVLHRRGAIECADIRLPGAKLDAATTAALDRVLDWTEKRRRP